MNKYKHIFKLACILLLLTVSVYAEPVKKKIYIYNLLPSKGISSAIAEKIRDNMILSVLGNYKERYSLVTDDEIKIMYKQAEELMRVSCEGDACIQQIGNALDADEIIYGTISSDGGKIKANMKNLVRNRSSLEINIKNFVTMSFFESQLEWYSVEIAKKLINPEYRIDESKAPSIISGGFNVKKIELMTEAGKTISTLKFENKDREITKFIDYFKELIEKGDTYFKKEQYDDARETYIDTLTKIENRLSAEKRQEVETFSQDIEKRVAATYTKEFEKKIGAIDKKLESTSKLTIKDLRDGEYGYKNIFILFGKINTRYSRWMESAEQAIISRLNSVYNTMAVLKEKEGDSWYGKYKFQKAIDVYREGIAILGENTNSNDEVKSTQQRLQDKITTTKITGTSWLENQVWSYCDQAEYLNIRDRLSEAKILMEKTGYLISAHNEFSNAKIEEKYKITCKLVKYDSSAVGKDVANLQTSDSSFYLTGGILSWGLTAGAFGAGYFFNTKVISANDDYNKYSREYDNSTNINEATRLHKDMESTHKDAEKYTLYRNISYGIGAVAFISAVIFTYKFIVYKSVESQIEEQRADSGNIFFAPVYSGKYSILPGMEKTKQSFYGAVVMFRF